MVTSEPAESFRDLLLRHRGRTGLTQRELAARVGVSRRAIQVWEAGVNYPSANRLRAVITTLLAAGALTPGRELEGAEAMWSAVQRDSVRMCSPFDRSWFATLPGQQRNTHEPPP